MAETEISWRAPEFKYREKGMFWYWLTVILAVIILSATIWQKNFIFAAFIVAAEILILVWGSRRPENIEFKLTEDGLAAGEDKFYERKEIGGFGFTGNPDDEWNTLSVELKRKISSRIEVIIPASKTEEIRKIFQAFAEEKEYHMSLVDALEELLKF